MFFLVNLIPTQNYWNVIGPVYLILDRTIRLFQIKLKVCKLNILHYLKNPLKKLIEESKKKKRSVRDENYRRNLKKKKEGKEAQN